MAEQPVWLDHPAAAAPGATGEQPLWMDHPAEGAAQFETVPTTGDVSTAEDVVKSGGAGIVSGTAGIVGAPGDLAGVMSHLVHKAQMFADPSLTEDELKKRQDAFWEEMNKPENIAAAARQGQIIAKPATSSDLIEGLESATGEKLHEPQTRLGRGAKTVGEFVPGALALGPEGALSNFLKLALAPGVASEAAGQVLEGSPFEGAARFLAGLFGGGAAIGAGKGVEAATNAANAKTAAQQIGPDVTGGAVSRMAKSFEADKLTPEIVAEKRAQLGDDAMMLDMGRQMQGRAEAVASQPGQGQNAVLDAVEKRVHGTDQWGNVQSQFGAETAQRIKDTMNQQFGQSQNKVDLINGVSDMIDKQSKPLYDAVMAKHPVVEVPASITSRPVVQQAMGDATSLAKNYGETLQGPPETKTILSGPGYHIADDVENPAKTSLQYWDYVKKALDQRINGMIKQGGIDTLDSADKADLGGMISARNALRDHLDQVTDGEYADARRVAALKPQLNEAYEIGQSAFNNRLLPEEFEDQLKNMSIPEEGMARAGFRRELERVVDVARNDGAAARQMLDTNQNLDKVQSLFGAKARIEIENRIAAETKFQDAANKIAANSRTQVRGQLAKDTESPSVGALPMANIPGLAYKGLIGGLQYLRNTGMENTRAAIGRMSTAQGSDLDSLAGVLAGYAAKRAANQGTPIARQVGALARQMALPAASRDQTNQ